MCLEEKAINFQTLVEKLVEIEAGNLIIYLTAQHFYGLCLFFHIKLHKYSKFSTKIMECLKQYWNVENRKLNDNCLHNGKLRELFWCSFDILIGKDVSYNYISFEYSYE